MPQYLNFTSNKTLLFLVIVWTLIWKGIALWKSARADQRNWFIAIFIINTFGLLELFYLYVIPQIPEKYLKKISWKKKHKDAEQK